MKKNNNPSEMTGTQINKELDSLDNKLSVLIEKLISSGRGHEKHSEIVSKNDPVSIAYKAISDRQNELYAEIHARVGNDFHRIPHFALRLRRKDKY